MPTYTATGHRNVRSFTADSGDTRYQVRVHPFEAENHATLDEALGRASELRRLRADGYRYLPAGMERRHKDGHGIGSVRARWLSYLQTVTRKGNPLSPATLEASARHTHYWEQALGSDFPVEALTVELIVEHAEPLQSERGRASAYSHRRALKQLLRWAASIGISVPAPVLSMSIGGQPRLKEPVALTLPQVDYLSQRMPDESARDIVWLQGRVGNRISELLHAHPSHFSAADGELFVPAENAKENRDKAIPLTTEEQTFLRVRISQLPAGAERIFPVPMWGARAYSSYYPMWERGLAAAKADWSAEHGSSRTPFDGLQPEHMRHTAITSMLEADMPVDTVAARVGHADDGGVLLKHYAQRRNERTRKAVRDLGGSLDAAVARGGKAGQAALAAVLARLPELTGEERTVAASALAALDAAERPAATLRVLEGGGA